MRKSFHSQYQSHLKLHFICLKHRDKRRRHSEERKFKEMELKEQRVKNSRDQCQATSALKERKKKCLKNNEVY